MKKNINILVAQTLEELKYIVNSINHTNYICLPLNLETQLYCSLKKINYLDLTNFLDNNFHERALIESNKLIKNLDCRNLKKKSQKEIYRSLIRFKFYSIYFLVETINKVKKKYNLKNIYASGWNCYDKQYSYNNYFLSYLLKNLFKNEKLIFVKKLNFENIKSKTYSFYLTDTIVKYRKNASYILMNNIGYNFIRIVLFSFFFSNNKFIIPVEKQEYNFSPLKKLIFKILNVNFITLQKKEINNNNFKITDINYKFKKINLSKILNYFKNQETGNHYSLYLKQKIIDEIFKNIKINLVIVNFFRGLSGYMIEKAIEYNTKCIILPHGTISKFFNKFDKIYKKIIADTLILNHKKVFILAQSSITLKFKKYFNYKNNFLNFGNFIFAHQGKSFFRKNYILYAVTLKDFKNLQFFGTEMFYEFLSNLEIIDNLARTNKLKFIVKPHPSEFKCINYLKNKFKNIIFSTENVSKLLKKSFVTISFSSTVIEDSLNSNVPVILFDQWKRYKHCESEKDPLKKNQPVYYVNNKQDLMSCIKTLRLSKNIYFDKYVKKFRTFGYFHNLKYLFKIYLK